MHFLGCLCDMRFGVPLYTCLMNIGSQNVAYEISVAGRQPPGRSVSSIAPTPLIKKQCHRPTRLKIRLKCLLNGEVSQVHLE